MKDQNHDNQQKNNPIHPQIPSQKQLPDIIRKYFLNREDVVGSQWISNDINPTYIDSEEMLKQIIVLHSFGKKVEPIQIGYITYEIIRIGAYSPAPDGKTKWLCIDIDGGTEHSSPLKNPRSVKLEIRNKCSDHGLPSYIEKSKSGEGFHLWIFFSEPVEAELVRNLGFYLCPKDAKLLNGDFAKVRRNQGLEIFPKQNRIKEGGKGNLIWLPWYSVSNEGCNLFYEVDDSDNLQVIQEPITSFETVEPSVLKELLQKHTKKNETAITLHGQSKRESNDGFSFNSNNNGKVYLSKVVRDKIIQELDLNEIYGNWLTGNVRNDGWLECRDPWSATGDRNPSAGVADGSRLFEKGIFHYFRTNETYSVFDFVVKIGTANNYNEAVKYASDKTGVPLPSTPSSEWEDLEVAIQFFNDRHAVVSFGSSTAILWEREDPESKDSTVDFMKQGDFQLLYKNKKVKIEKDNGQYVLKNAVNFWLEHPDRRTYEQVIFSPGFDDPRCFNLWRGFAVEPEEGDCSLYLEHIRDVICNGKEKYYDYLISWMADAVQNPNNRPGTAVVLRGGQGTGKGIFCRQFGKLFGRHFLHVSHSRHLVGNFNSHLKDCLVLFADEAFWAGDKQGENVLKALITEPDVMIEIKGRDVITMANKTRLLIASNNDWVVPAGTDERRYFVLDVSEKRKQDRRYFGLILDQMDHGGREALLYYLQNYDLSGIDLGDLPKTEALLEQKLQSMKPSAKFWYERLLEGTILPEHERWQQEVFTDDLYQHYCDCARVTGTTRKNWMSEFGKEIKKYCPHMTKITLRKAIEINGISSSKKSSAYQFPCLNECRVLFENYLNMPIEWSQNYNHVDVLSEDNEFSGNREISDMSSPSNPLNTVSQDRIHYEENNWDLQATETAKSVIEDFDWGV